MFCFYSAACYRSDGSLRAAAKLDRRSGSSVLALQHTEKGDKEDKAQVFSADSSSSNIKHLEMIIGLR